jgi:hypothetical protein
MYSSINNSQNVENLSFALEKETVVAIFYCRIPSDRING